MPKEYAIFCRQIRCPFLLYLKNLIKLNELFFKPFAVPFWQIFHILVIVGELSLSNLISIDSRKSDGRLKMIKINF